MKTVDAPLRDHLDQEVTALCTCWIITRRDGQQYRFTDADEDVVHDGDTYESFGAYQRSSIESTATLAVDNLEVQGISNTLSLPVEELRAGAFDNAEIKVFMTSWLAAVEGKVRLRRGFFGEVKVLPNGTFSVELRGVMQRLSHTYTEVYTPTCRNDLGDSKCRIIIFPDFYDTTADAPANVAFWVPQPGKKLGTVRALTLGDPDFDALGAFGFETSRYWTSVGADDPEFVATGSVGNGTHSLSIGSGSDIQVDQYVALNEIENVEEATIETGQLSLNVMSLWNCPVDEGRIVVDFFDRYNREINDNTLSKIASGGTADTLSLTGDFAVEGWFYWPSGNSISHFTFSGTNSFGQDYTEITMSGNRPVVQYRDPSNSIDDQQEIITGNHDVPRDEWFHLAFTRTGNEYAIIVNGGLRTTATNSFTEPFLIDNVWNGSFFFDELRIWNTTVTEADIAGRRFRKVDATDPDLVRYWTAFSASELANGGSALSGATIGASDEVTVSPVAVTTSEGGSSVSASLAYATTSGLENRTLSDVQIPVAARYARVRVQMQAVGAGGEGAIIDSIRAWVIDETVKDYPVGTFGNTDNVKDSEDVVSTQEAYTRGGIVTVSEGTRIFRCELDEDRAVDGWFNFGMVRFETGKNAGGAMEVKNWTRDGNIIELFLSMPSNIEPGDQFYIYPGCDKTRVCCSAFFDNIQNFSGTPDIPGEDEFMRYPDAK